MVDVWSLIAPNVKVAKGYSGREIDVLKDVESFYIRNFQGSGRWTYHTCDTYEGTLTLAATLSRPIIYAARAFPDGPHYANLPSTITPALMVALCQVGKPQNGRHRKLRKRA